MKYLKKIGALALATALTVTLFTPGKRGICPDENAIRLDFVG